MNLRNNNREIIRNLAKKSYRYSRGRNRVLISATALAVIVVFCVLSIASGRLEADRLRDMRDDGMAPSYSLENPTDRQYRNVKALPYIRYAGKEWNFGTAFKDQYHLISCTAVSKETFLNIYAPAYTDIEGGYPEKSNEVMLPLRALEELGIDSPNIGMKLKLDLSINDKAREDVFVLSGYFTDYQNGTKTIPKGFFSMAYLKERDIRLNRADLLRIEPQELLNAAEGVDEEIARLRRDAGISKEQQLEGYFIGYLAYSEWAGGYGAASLFILVLLLCAALLINNVSYIFLNRDIRHYGLLITLGASQRQIEKILLRQVLRISIIGILIGITVSCFIILYLFPSLLQHLYLTNCGPATERMGFHPLWLAVTVLLVFLITLISAMGPARKVSSSSPVDAGHYAQSGKRMADFRNSEKGGRIYRQAWRYAFLNKRKAIVTIVSVVIGIVVTLIAVMVTEGYDTAREIEKEPDFELYTGLEPDWEGKIQLDRETEDKILGIEGVKLDECTYGDFFILDKADAVWKPVIEDADLVAGAIMADDAYLEKLDVYVREHGRNIDIEGLKTGDSAVEIYANRLSGAELQKANEKIGDSFRLADMNESFLGSLKFGGYLDQSKKGFPKTRLIMHSLHTPILLMTEKAFRRAGLEPKIDYLSLTVEPGREPVARKELEEIIAQRNKELRTDPNSPDSLTLSAKSDDRSYNEENMTAQRIMAYGITVLLLMMGIMNYFNIIITGIFSRGRELAVLECVGMTRKQLRRMLALEGCYYSVIIAAISSTLGTAVLFGAAKYMKSKFYFFQFEYPWTELLIMLAAFFLFSVFLPLIAYRRNETAPMAERLQYNK